MYGFGGFEGGYPLLHHTRRRPASSPSPRNHDAFPVRGRAAARALARRVVVGAQRVDVGIPRRQPAHGLRGHEDVEPSGRGVGDADVGQSGAPRQANE